MPQSFPTHPLAIPDKAFSRHGKSSCRCCRSRHVSPSLLSYSWIQDAACSCNAIAASKNWSLTFSNHSRDSHPLQSAYSLIRHTSKRTARNQLFLWFASQFCPGRQDNTPACWHCPDPKWVKTLTLNWCAPYIAQDLTHTLTQNIVVCSLPCTRFDPHVDPHMTNLHDPDADPTWHVRLERCMLICMTHMLTQLELYVWNVAG